MLFLESSFFGHTLSRILTYSSFRAAMALTIAFILALILGKFLIPALKKMQGKGQPIRDCGPESHLVKQGTPTMGGIIIILSFLIASLLFANLRNPLVLIGLAVPTSFFFIGFFDDFFKLKTKSADGTTRILRLVLEFATVIVAIYFIQKQMPFGSENNVLFPFFKNFSIDLGMFFIVFASIVAVGTANAVNITDGLDGLATLLSVNTFIVLGVFAFLLGRIDYSSYLHFQYLPNVAELPILISAMVGSLIGFYWYNSKPAQIFMGDCGSLAIGGFMGVIAIMLKSEFLLAICGVIFVAELASSFLQVYYYKLSRKFSKSKTPRKLFKMAPLHHHFEVSGWKEEKVVARFWIISIISCLIALISLKLR